MWSGIYNYYSIQSDLEFTRKEKSTFVANLLNPTEKFKKKIIKLLKIT